jgi:hypothetical protein
VNEYVITDTQGLKGIVEIDMFTLRIKKAWEIGALIH